MKYPFREGFQSSALTFSIPGCWQIVAHVGLNARFVFVVRVKHTISTHRSAQPDQVALTPAGQEIEQPSLARATGVSSDVKAPRVGLEPTTLRLTAECSAN